MIAPAEPPRPGVPRAWLALGLLAALCAAGLLAIVVGRAAEVHPNDDYAAVRAHFTSDFRDYWWTARHFRLTGELSDQFGVQDYLPFFAIFMTPWSLLPLQVAAVAFTALSLGLLALTVIMAETLLNDRLGPRPRPALILSLALMLPYVYSCAVLGGVGLLVAFLVVAAWLLFERGREWEAGAALGLATLIKLLPGLLIVFFVLKRRWRAALAAAATCLVLGLGLPLLSLGPKGAFEQHTRFYRRAVQDHSAWATITSDGPPKIQYKNAALPAVLRRLLTPTAGSSDETRAPVNALIADLPRGLVFGLYATLIVAMLAASCLATLRIRALPVESLADVEALRAQFGVWCAAMLLAAPLLWIHYLPMAYWPLAMLADRAERGRQSGDRTWYWSVAALIGWLVAAILLAWPAARAAGAQLAALALLWLVLVLWCLRRRSAR